MASVPVVRRADYTISLEYSQDQFFAHATVSRWNAAIARRMRADFERLMELHGGPVYATSHEPHGDDYHKFRKFVLFFGFSFFCTVSHEGVRHSVYVRDRCR